MKQPKKKIRIPRWLWVSAIAIVVVLIILTIIGARFMGRFATYTYQVKDGQKFQLLFYKDAESVTKVKSTSLAPQTVALLAPDAKDADIHPFLTITAIPSANDVLASSTCQTPVFTVTNTATKQKQPVCAVVTNDQRPAVYLMPIIFNDKSYLVLVALDYDTADFPTAADKTRLSKTLYLPRYNAELKEVFSSVKPVN